MPDDYRVEQSEKTEDNEWWEWAVWLEGPDRDLDAIDFVEWTLHPSFPDPIRKTSDRAHNFRLDTGGWGVFQILARLQLKDGRQLKLSHFLQLKRTDGTQNLR